MPTDPLAEKQWHLATTRAYDFWDALPLLPPVKVAVIDSGIDADHPEFDGKIAAAESFVGGSAFVDREGHGTFVAGLIAAGVDNGIGIAGMAPSAELLVAKVVNSDEPDRRRGGGPRDPLGGAEGRARDQHEPRRACATPEP